MANKPHHQIIIEDPRRVERSAQASELRALMLREAPAKLQRVQARYDRIRELEGVWRQLKPFGVA